MAENTNQMAHILTLRMQQLLSKCCTYNNLLHPFYLGGIIAYACKATISITPPCRFLKQMSQYTRAFGGNVSISSSSVFM